MATAGARQSRAPGPRRPPAEMGRRALRGFLWLGAQTLTTKLISSVGQIVLAWLLLEEDFGQVGLAYGVAGFGALISHCGLREMLIQRHHGLRRWANPMFWMSLAIGALSLLIMAALAPVAGAIYGDSDSVPGLILVLAGHTMVMGLDLVPRAKLVSDLRFRLLAAVNVAAMLGTMTLAIAMAALGFGPYSFVVPQLVTAAGTTTILWLLARPPIRHHPQFRRWKYLFADSARMLGSNMARGSTYQTDRLLLGLFQSDVVVGTYYFAFRHTHQTLALFTENLNQVLLPTLSKMRDDPARQLRGFLHATHLMAVVVVPVCLLQVAAAEPAIHLIFPERWYPAILILQVMAAGMTLRAVSATSDNMIIAQGRFGALVRFQLAFAAVFAASAAVGSWRGSAVGAATGVSIAMAVFAPIHLYVAISALGGRWSDILRIYARPLVAAALAGGVSVAAATHLLTPLMGPGHGAWRELGRLLVVCGVMGGAYLLLIRRLDREACAELARRFAELRRRRSRSAGALGSAAAPEEGGGGG